MTLGLLCHEKRYRYRRVGGAAGDRMGPAGPSGETMTSLDIAELLSEVRAMRQEIAEIKLAMAEERGKNLSAKVYALEHRVNKLELWRAGLIAISSASGAGILAVLAKLFGG